MADEEAKIAEALERQAQSRRIVQGAVQVLNLPPGSHIMRVGFRVGDSGTLITSLSVMDLKIDDSGMPEHLPMGLTINHDGPVEVDDPEFHHWGCWCGDHKCEEFWRQGG